MILGREPIFMSKYIFNLLCDYIKEQRRIIPYGRLLSDIFYQSSIIEQLEEMKTGEDLRIIFGKAFNAHSLIQMKIIKKVQSSNITFCITKSNLVYLEDFHIISKLDCEEVIKEYILLRETK